MSYDLGPSLLLNLPTMDLSTLASPCGSMLNSPSIETPCLKKIKGTTIPQNGLSQADQLELIQQEFNVESVPSTFDVKEFINAKIDKHNLENPFYVVDIGVIKKKLMEWREELPRVEPFYAIKCNPHPAVIRTLKSYGIGFDCASKTEISTIVETFGVDSSKVIFANPCKPPTHLQYAKEHGVDMMTFDNLPELIKIKQNHPEAKLILRVLTDDSSSICRFGSKFGAPPQHIPVLLRKALELGLQVVGLSFHVGSGCLSSQAFVDAVQYAHRVFHQAMDLGIKMSILDIGGGFPGATDPYPHPSFKDIAAALRPVLDDLFPADLGVRIIAEPGRYFAAESHTLAVCVYARRDVQLEKEELGLVSLEDNCIAFPDGNPEDESMLAPDFLYYVNDGVYGSFNCIFFDHAQVTPLPVCDKEAGVELSRATIFGPTCDSMDCIIKNFMMPKLEVGEWLYFKEMGAYTSAAASKFNGFDRPAMFFVDSYIKIYPG
eukprot:TRINITY_DN17893_c0_g1_i1.p1 TRINITY_DN17893_c0_g1~~TRINITY_DN17893_c0_g1_i1.p1  ORF type:complete len:506 (+),score=112.24 TRINITY_DN17893_c0_g1_i1:50-1519(+)